MGDGNAVEVEGIENFILLLKTEFYLNLDKTFIVPSFRENLISIVTSNKSGYSCLLKIDNSICFIIQNWFVSVLYQAMIIFILLIRLLHLMNPYN